MGQRMLELSDKKRKTSEKIGGCCEHPIKEEIRLQEVQYHQNKGFSPLLFNQCHQHRKIPIYSLLIHILVVHSKSFLVISQLVSLKSESPPNKRNSPCIEATSTSIDTVIPVSSYPGLTSFPYTLSQQEKEDILRSQTAERLQMLIKC